MRFHYHSCNPPGFSSNTRINVTLVSMHNSKCLILGPLIGISCCEFHTPRINFVFNYVELQKNRIYSFKRIRNTILFCCATQRKQLYIVCNPQYEVSFLQVQTLESSDVGAYSKVRDFSNNISHSCAHYCFWAILSWRLQRKAEKS